MTGLIKLIFKLYHWLISPWLGARCRFTPSCSVYAQDALKHHGAVKGSYLAAKRICRCHPWGGSGYDPVPGLGDVALLEQADNDPHNNHH